MALSNTRVSPRGEIFRNVYWTSIGIFDIWGNLDTIVLLSVWYQWKSKNCKKEKIDYFYKYPFYPIIETSECYAWLKQFLCKTYFSIKRQTKKYNNSRCVFIKDYKMITCNLRRNFFMLFPLRKCPDILYINILFTIENVEWFEEIYR